jgi:glucose-6-phosphate isomerase
MVAGTQGVDLSVADARDTGAVQAALRGAADVAVVVAGSDAATLSGVVRAVHELGVDPARRVVVVARPGSQPDLDARAAGLPTVPWEDAVGDRFSALSAPSLVAAGLAGADLGELLDEAESEELNLAIDDPANNGLRLGAALGGSRPAAVALVTDGTHLVGADLWAAHLLTGAGLDPRVLDPEAPELAEPGADLQVIRLVGDAHATARIAPHEIRLSGSLGELILALEYATAVAAWLRGADPFSEESA